MTATVASLSARRQALGLPPPRPIPRQIQKGDRVRVPKLGFRVGSVMNSCWRNDKGDHLLGVMLNGCVVACWAADCVLDDGSQGPKSAA